MPVRYRTIGSLSEPSDSVDKGVCAGSEGMMMLTTYVASVLPVTWTNKSLIYALNRIIGRERGSIIVGSRTHLDSKPF